MQNKQWFLGDLVLQETNTYKYLGIVINRRLKDNDHIKQHLIPKAKNLESYIRFTLAKHMDINRVNFGNTIWQKAIQPSLSHAAAVWLNDSKSACDRLSSIQYNFGKAVLKIKCMPSKTATLAELGWLPFCDHLDIKRISYYTHLIEMNGSRLTKIVYDELVKLYKDNRPTAFNYVEGIRNILTTKGLDCMFDNAAKVSVAKFKQFTSACHAEHFYRDIGELSSLLHYRVVKENTSMSKYLNSTNTSFKGIQLKFKLRTGVSGIGEDLYRQHRGPGM
jgi:hypothetical protein